MKTVKYIYGIINSEAFISMQANKHMAGQGSGMENIAKALSDEESQNGRRLEVVSFKDISAVVNNVPEMLDFTNMPKDALTAFLFNYQKVNEKIMSFDLAVIPVKFGTFAENEDQVKDVLHKGYRLIKSTLDKIEQKIEWDVTAVWGDFKTTLLEAGEEKEIKELKKALLANPKGISMEDQVKIGQMMKKALDEKRDRYSSQIEDALKAESHHFKGHELMDDKMVANLAFLIDKNKQANFDKQLEELNARLAGKLNFRCVGPLPPYSFYTIEIKKIPFEEIDKARKQFGLNKITGKKEIKKAYQQNTLLLHPDKNRDKPGIEKKFQEMVRAYQLLLDYCRAHEQVGDDDRASFHEQEFNKDAVLVKVME